MMVDTTARPSDIHRLYQILDGKHCQIEFFSENGHDGVSPRYFWSKEVGPRSSRSNATNVWFSKWVTVHCTAPSSVCSHCVLRNFLVASSAYSPAGHFRSAFSVGTEGARPLSTVLHGSYIQHCQSRPAVGGVLDEMPGRPRSCNVQDFVMRAGLALGGTRFGPMDHGSHVHSELRVSSGPRSPT